MKERFIVKSFKCTCGSKFSELVRADKIKIACNRCKGIAKEYKTEHKPPMYKVITEKVAICPNCGSRLKKARHINADVATMFDWVCLNCNHVC
jgi:rRNA maturation endonuclease Nob1